MRCASTPTSRPGIGIAIGEQRLDERQVLQQVGHARTSRGSACRRGRAAPRSARAPRARARRCSAPSPSWTMHVADHVVVAGEEAALAEDLQPAVRRALEHVVPEVDQLGAQAAGELELDGDVVLDARVAGAVLLPGAQAGDRAEEPGQQVEVVHAVLDQRAAGGEARGPCATPVSCTPRIGKHLVVAEDHRHRLADVGGAQQVAHHACRRPRSAAPGRSAPCTPARRTASQHRLRLGVRHRQRLLAEEVLAGRGGGVHELGVERGRRADEDGVDVGAREQVARIGEGVPIAVEAGEQLALLRASGSATAVSSTCSGIASAIVRSTAECVAADQPGADEADADRVGMRTVAPLAPAPVDGAPQDAAAPRSRRGCGLTAVRDGVCFNRDRLMFSKYVASTASRSTTSTPGARRCPMCAPALDRGELLLFLHGAGSNAHTWHRQLDALRRAPLGGRARLPGHGRSGSTDGSARSRRARALHRGVRRCAGAAAVRAGRARARRRGGDRVRARPSATRAGAGAGGDAGRASRSRRPASTPGAT